VGVSDIEYNWLAKTVDEFDEVIREGVSGVVHDWQRQLMNLMRLSEGEGTIDKVFVMFCWVQIDLDVVRQVVNQLTCSLVLGRPEVLVEGE